jgi:heme a synthase
MNQAAIWQFSLDAWHALAWAAALLVTLIGCLRWPRLSLLVGLTLGATLILVMLGAYVRLSDAGLGCPDWPGCYGKISPSHAAEEIEAAQLAAPAGPVSPHKAWREMLHRYLASLVGIMILAIAWRTLRARQQQGGSADDPSRQPGLPLLLVGLVILQGLLGKWTVTLLLKPAIVTLHLLGGMALIVGLAWLMARHWGLQGGQPSSLRVLRLWPLLTWALVGMQVALGGWVSTNYAALACVDFPTCHGTWIPMMDFASGFHFMRELGMTVEGVALSNEALNAIHWTHRIGALVVLLATLVTYWQVSRVRALQDIATTVLILLGIQIALGVTNVLANLPLVAAVAHNGVAALLLIAVTMLNFAVRSPSMASR